MGYLVGHGDHTTTGGRVLSASSTTFDNRKCMSQSGDKASCGNCEGVHPIIGSVDTWIENNKSMVQHRDRVMCPCRKNFVLASPDATISIDDGAGSAWGAQTSTPTRSTAEDSGHWIKFTLTESGSCIGLKCVAHFQDGSVESGEFDAHKTVRFSRLNGSNCTKVEIAVDGQDRSSGSAMESLLTAMTASFEGDSFAGRV